MRPIDILLYHTPLHSVNSININKNWLLKLHYVNFFLMQPSYLGSNKFELSRWGSFIAAFSNLSFKDNFVEFSPSRRAKLLVKLLARGLKDEVKKKIMKEL